MKRSPKVLARGTERLVSIKVAASCVTLSADTAGAEAAAELAQRAEGKSWTTELERLPAVTLVQREDVGRASIEKASEMRRQVLSFGGTSWSTRVKCS